MDLKGRVQAGNINVDIIAWERYLKAENCMKSPRKKEKYKDSAWEDEEESAKETRRNILRSRRASLRPEIPLDNNHKILEVEKLRDKTHDD